MIVLKLSNYCQILQLSQYVETTDVILYSLRTQTLVRISNVFFNNLKAENFDKIPSRLLEILVNKEFLVPVDEDELVVLKNKEKCFNQDGMLIDGKLGSKFSTNELLIACKKVKLIG